MFVCFSGMIEAVSFYRGLASWGFSVVQGRILCGSNTGGYCI